MPKSWFLRLTWTIPHQKHPPTNMDQKKHLFCPCYFAREYFTHSFIHTLLSLIHFIHYCIDSFMHRFIDSSIHWFIHYFGSFHFISCHVISFISFIHFMRSFIHFISFRFVSFNFIHSFILSITHALLHATVRMRFVSFRHIRSQNRIAGASHQIDQHSRDSTAQIWRYSERASFLRFFCNIELSFQFCAHLFCRPHPPKVPQRLQFLTFWNANRALATTSCTFLSRSSRETAETETLLRPPQESHTIPGKKHGFAPESALVTYEITRFRLPHANCSCSLCCWYDDHMMTWWWSLDDMMKRLPLDICPWLGSFRTKLPLIVTNYPKCWDIN